MLRRGIEPIIATVILVAVALIIAVAVVGYLMGLFGGLVGGQPQITITSYRAKRGDNKLQIELYVSNAGPGSDKLLRVEILHGGTSGVYRLAGAQPITLTSEAGGGEITIGGNYKGWLTFEVANHPAAPGDTIVLKLYFERSGVQTIYVVVSP